MTNHNCGKQNTCIVDRLYGLGVPEHWKAPKEYLNHRGTKFRVFRVHFRAPFLPPFFPHVSLSFPLKALFTLPPLVVRIAPPTSLAIWHRGRSHRRPNRSGSPNRRHFASLDLKNHPDFSHRRPASQVFRRLLFLVFSCDFRSSECVFASLAKKLFRIASDLGVCDSNRIAHRGSIVRFGPLSCHHFFPLHLPLYSPLFFLTPGKLRFRYPSDLGALP